MAKQKVAITINFRDIIKVLRIITILFAVSVLSFVLLFYGIFSPESYFGCLILVIFVIYIILPVIFCLSADLQQSMVFQPHVDAKDVDFEKPCGLKGVQNLKITTNNETLGVWHILPSSLSEECDNKDESFWKESIKAKNNKVMIYFHGVTGTRGKWHRKELYRVLQSHEYHIISCDYRGFGDSTKVKRITETGVVADALTVYRWVRSDLLGGDNSIPVFVWGHSLGAGISSHVLTKLSEATDVPPTGLVLESPFDNFAEELRNHRKLKLWSSLPFFDSLFVHPLRKNDITFQNDGHITKISVPIMILHAKDDNVVPSHLGRRLYEAGRLRRSQDCHPLHFVHMKAGKHNEMYKENLEFGQILTLFTNACIHKTGCWHHQMEMEILCSHC